MSITRKNTRKSGFRPARDKLDYHVEESRSVERAGRYLVRKLDDRAGDPASDSSAFMVVDGLKFGGARGAFDFGLVAIALEHQLSCAPIVDLGYHTPQVVLPR